MPRSSRHVARLMFLLVLLASFGAVACKRKRPPLPYFGVLDRREARAPSPAEQALLDDADHSLERTHGDPRILASAREKLRRALQTNPDLPLAYVLLAKIELLSGYRSYDFYDPAAIQRAQEPIRIALSYEPPVWRTYYWAAAILLAERRYAEAEEMSKLAYQMSPEAPRIWIFRADFMRLYHHYDEAIAQLQRHVLDNPASTDLERAHAYEVLTGVYGGKGDDAAEDAAFQSELALVPDDPWIDCNYAAFLRRVGRLDEAEARIRKALSEMNFGMAHHVLGSIYVAQGKLALQRGDAADASALFSRALVEDEKLAKSILEIDPSNQAARAIVDR